MPRKKLLLLSSYGGYGHIAAANTIKRILGDRYEIETIYPIDEMRVFGVRSGESLYNFLIAHNWNRITNWVASFFIPLVFNTHLKSLTKLLERHLSEKKPDLLISLIPCVNLGATIASQNQNVPFLISTTDNDIVNWIRDFEKRPHNNFKVTVGFDLPTSKRALLAKQVPEEGIETIGLPLRIDFLNVDSREALRTQYEIPEGKKVVLIMMGGVGSTGTYAYVKELAKTSLSLHIMVCTGRNKRLAAKLKGIKMEGNNTIDILPFTEKVHELFALSDLLITKPGPGTINEALALKVPVLIDLTQPPLFWEAANIDLVKQLQVGEAVSSYHEAPALVEKYLFDPETIDSLKKAYEKVPKNQFAERIESLIEELIAEEPLVTASLL